ncbi:TlpA family protein disulfide reductase [Eubacterium ruminantium]|uniref:TlpA family protein disulfide reductase n=1 Tax=Eubacterium ruminantium TaxID=42322 RepID=UPI001567E48E|nr:TlpA disulfide reductase family protein [Eubacterium ruminantium]
MNKRKTVLIYCAVALIAVAVAVYFIAKNNDSKKDKNNDKAAANSTSSTEGSLDSSVDSSESNDTISSEASTENGNLSTEEATESYKIKVLSEGDKAPDFTAELVSGETFKLSDHSDEVVLINFWATWCGPCVNEMPAFESLKNDNIDGFTLVCINCNEDKSTVDQYVKECGYTYNIAYDTDNSIGQYYPTDGIPYTLIINKGIVSKIFLGADNAEHMYKEYKSAVEEALSSK